MEVNIWICIEISMAIRASRSRNLGTHFSVHRITCFCTRSCTLHFVHLKLSLVYVFLLTSTSLCNYYKIRYINPETSLGIQTVLIEKETTDRSLVYSEPNKQTTFCQPCLKAMNMVSPSQCL